MFQTRPHAAPGQRIGLLGGSFDPAHDGHVHISRIALRRIGLDRVWWLLSPGNPLKPNPPAPLERRMTAARDVIGGHPRIMPTGIERSLGTRYTVDTLRALRRLYPQVRFVWLMGSDNLSQFHRWHDWAGIMATLPIAVLARPGERARAGLSMAARRFARARLPARAASALPFRDAPCWTMLTHPLSPASSTAIRAEGGW